MRGQNLTISRRNVHRSCRARIAIAVLLLGVVGVASAQVPPRGEEVLLRSPDWSVVQGVARAPSLHARAAILVEAETGAVLAAKNRHLVLPAASLTKVVAIHAAMVADRTGEIDLQSTFSPPPEAWAANMPLGSSLMFLRRNQELTVWQLLEGLAISSGNDAALALALFVDSGVPGFAQRMNATVRDAGLVSTGFVEPSGLSPFNLTTAYEYAAFVRVHLRTFPELLDGLYSRMDYTYPQPQNILLPDAGPPILQSNRNLLLSSYDGADGIKTGYIDESGYHLAATAERDGRRLIAVVMGVDAPSHADGGRMRAEDAAALLDYGFDEFELLRFAPPAGAPVRAYLASERYIQPIAPGELAVSVPVGAGSRLEGHAEQIAEVIAPVAMGAQAGWVEVSLDGVMLAKAAITLPETPRGGLLRRTWDSILLFFRTLFGADRPPSGRSLQVAAG